MAQMIVDAWTDVICPWCWIGDLRLEKALHRFDARDQVVIRYRSYRLMPGIEQQPVVALMRNKTGGDDATVNRMFAHVESVARGEGLTYNIARTIAGDTIDAHRIIHLGNTEGIGDAVLKRLYRAHFTEGLSVFSYQGLSDLAVDAGLDRDRVTALLASDEFRAEVEADQNALQSRGAQGVPFYRIGAQEVSGAQPIETFLQALNRAWTEHASAETEASFPVCGPDGCY